VRDHLSIQRSTVTLAPSWVLAYREGDLTLLRDHEVTVEEGTIVAVRPRQRASDVVELPGQILLPGFISAHSHASTGVATRGYVESNLTPLSKVPQLRERRQYLRAMELIDDLPDEEVDDITALNLAEMLRSGCTTQVEMSVSLKQMKSYVRVARRYRMRGYPSAGAPGMKRLLAIWKREGDHQVLFDSVPETLSEIEANLDYARSINGVDDGRILPMMAALTNVANTPETFLALRKAAEELNGLHLHFQAGYGRPPFVDADALNGLWGYDEVPWLESMGILDEGVPVFGAHLLGVDFRRDLDILAAHPNFTFGNCPSGTGAGVSPAQWPWPEALAAGVNCGIGLDTHSNDYVENMKLAVMYGRARADMLGDSTPVPMVRPSIWNAIESATLAPARGLGRSDIGRIEEGAKADLTSIDVSGLLVGVGVTPLEPLNHLMYANGLSVTNVMTDGYWQVRDRQLVVDDEATVRARGGAVVQNLWAQMEAEGMFVDMPRSDLIPASAT
jgi:5-methylthioadenosine/S-adenosylhomocysteine deaminase